MMFWKVIAVDCRLSIYSSINPQINRKSSDRKSSPSPPHLFQHPYRFQILLQVHRDLRAERSLELAECRTRRGDTPECERTHRSLRFQKRPGIIRDARIRLV